MTRFRIVCTPEPPPKLGTINGTVASWQDTHVFLVRDDGTEEDISHLVESVAWRVETGEPARCTLTIYNAAINATAIVACECGALRQWDRPHAYANPDEVERLPGLEAIFAGVVTPLGVAP